MSDTTIVCAGIDTAKESLEAAICGAKQTLPTLNDKPGFKRIAAWFQKAGVTHVGIEATGRYERRVVTYLRAAGFKVFVLQPLQVKAFAQFKLRRAKSDPLDAQLIAACTAALDLDSRPPPDARFEALGDQLTVLEQFEEDIARFKTRLEHISDPRLRKIVLNDIARLEKRRTKERRGLIAALRRHEDLARRFELVESVPGIGERTALSVVIRLPEIMTLSREQAASLAGLAPFVHSSGKYVGQTHIGGGRARLRRALYAAAQPAASQWNPALKALYARLTAKGRCRKAALVACARKMLIFALSVVQRGMPWEDSAKPAAA